MISLLVEATLRSAALFGTVWLVLKLIRLRDLRTEKRVWTMVTALSLAMPLLMQIFAIPIPARALPVQVVSKVDVLAAAQTGIPGLETMLLAMYGLVTAILLARLITGLWSVARLRRSARAVSIAWPLPLDVRESGQVRVPASFGSTILLPCEWITWDTRKLQAVIAHESAHIEQRDHYRLWLASLYCAVFWFNPCAGWLRRRLNVLAELVCDESAIAVVGDRIGYARVLMDLASGAPVSRSMIAMAAPATLTPRLKRLMESDMTSSNLGRSAKWVLMSALGIVAATAIFGCATPLVLTDAQDSQVKYVSGQLGDMYPKNLQAQHVEGMVTCRLTIDAEGRVTHAVAVKAANPELAAAAVKAVKTFRFNNTLARPVIKTMAVKFQLT